MRTRTLHARTESWPFKTPFRIAGHSWAALDIVTVEICEGEYRGRGEGIGVSYLGETAASIRAQIASLASDIENGLTRIELQELLPPGGARNALDCALWDLEAKRAGATIWSLTGVPPRSLVTVMTIGIDDTPELMAERAAAASAFPILKVKLDSDLVVERISAIRRRRPDARLCIDANQSWDIDLLRRCAPRLAELGVEMIEQPLPRDGDAALGDYRAPLPLCADESCLHLGELPPVLERYDMVNIKLDKTGGLTHALALAKAARAAGKQLMVGSMAGTSLGMAPAFVIGSLCDLVDIDGPLLMRDDRPQGLRFDGANVAPFSADLWG